MADPFALEDADFYAEVDGYYSPAKEDPEQSASDPTFADTRISTETSTPLTIDNPTSFSVTNEEQDLSPRPANDASVDAADPLYEPPQPLSFQSFTAVSGEVYDPAMRWYDMQWRKAFPEIKRAVELQEETKHGVRAESSRDPPRRAQMASNLRGRAKYFKSELEPRMLSVLRTLQVPSSAEDIDTALNTIDVGSVSQSLGSSWSGGVRDWKRNFRLKEVPKLMSKGVERATAEADVD